MSWMISQLKSEVVKESIVDGPCETIHHSRGTADKQTHIFCHLFPPLIQVYAS